MKNLITLLTAGMLLFACEQENELPSTDLQAPETEIWDDGTIPDDIDSEPPMMIPSIQEITNMQHAFYFIDNDNYLHVYNEGRLVCPYTYDYNAAQYVAFADLSNYHGILELESDTLVVDDGVVNYKKGKKSPGRATCNAGDIKRGGTGGSETSPGEVCTTGSGKPGTMKCTINTVTCVKSDGSTYTGRGTPGDCANCKKNKKGANSIGEIESECDF